MINRRTIGVVAGVTFVLFVITAMIGNDPQADFGPADLLWLGFLLSALLLIVLVLAAVGRAIRRRRTDVAR